MGGSYRAAGNTTPMTEWNVDVDPDSAKIVVDSFGTGAFGASGRPLPLALGLDVTEQAIMLPAHLDLQYARAGAPDFATRSSASSPTRSASTWSSMSYTTASMAPLSTIHWRWPPHSIRRWSRPSRSRSTWSSAALTTGRPLPTGGTSGAALRTSTWPSSRLTCFLGRFVERVAALAASSAGVGQAARIAYAAPRRVLGPDRAPESTPRSRGSPRDVTQRAAFRPPNRRNARIPQLRGAAG